MRKCSVLCSLQPSLTWQQLLAAAAKAEEAPTKYALSSFVGFAKGQTRLAASEESEDANMRGKITDFGSVSIVKGTLKMIEG
jgi:hypothetical protein